MNVLIVDSTREILLAILLKDDKMYVRKSLRGNSRHVTLLFVKIDELLTEAGIDAADIDFFAGIIGPGSYTGIRVGVCALTAMARANGKKLVSVNSLEVLGYGAKALGEYICLIDSGHDYYAMEVKDGVRRYFILDRNLTDGYDNKIIRDDNEYYIDNIVAVVKEKISVTDYGNLMIPFYMKKSQAGQSFKDIKDDRDFVL
ncbi:MAG: tRNA (adenosine(37)-N6)-threonylcarbamoyltransferase complex dimerization subunit type 1 TsaB [Clostridiales bacterium]|jgi:tRNA threonylcarbamoyl adenosine modification protein YeaZ|nr:tRNA (adenosine(37)-N6)-threonylcarbamoyltransferase complex dimerization subunit type 1 TsaB [Clostridiales bacterium]